MLLLLATLGSLARVEAHPMPDTEITVARVSERLAIVIMLPMEDLLLAVPNGTIRGEAQLAQGDQARLRAYFTDHLALMTADGVPVPASIDAIRMRTGFDSEIGTYRELELFASAELDGRRPVILDYDGVIHQVANHRAIVRDVLGAPIGVIRFSLAEKRATPVQIPAARAEAVLAAAARPDTLVTDHTSQPARAGWFSLTAGVLGTLALLLGVWLVWRPPRRSRIL